MWTRKGQEIERKKKKKETKEGKKAKCKNKIDIKWTKKYKKSIEERKRS